jgi:hypothetical protein
VDVVYATVAIVVSVPTASVRAWASRRVAVIACALRLPAA